MIFGVLILFSVFNLSADIKTVEGQKYYVIGDQEFAMGL